MPPALKTIGRIYTTLSLAVLPVAFIVMFAYLAGFKEHGPQSQGLPALMLIYAVIIGVLGVNTIVATLLSVLVVDVRPVKKQFFRTLLALAGLALVLYLGILLAS